MNDTQQQHDAERVAAIEASLGTTLYGLPGITASDARFLLTQLRQALAEVERGRERSARFRQFMGICDCCPVWDTASSDCVPMCDASFAQQTRESADDPDAPEWLSKLHADAARWAVVRDGWLSADLREGTTTFTLPGLATGHVKVSADPVATVDSARHYLATHGSGGGPSLP